MWFPLLLAFTLVVGCYQVAKWLRFRASTSPAVTAELTRLHLQARGVSIPVIVLITSGYLIWRRVDPEKAEPLYPSALMLALGTLLLAILFAWITSIRFAKQDAPLRYRIAAAYSVELLGVLGACAVARFL